MHDLPVFVYERSECSVVTSMAGEISSVLLTVLAYFATKTDSILDLCFSLVLLLLLLSGSIASFFKTRLNASISFHAA